MWLRDQVQVAGHAAIATYAEEMAGSTFDLDTNLESVGIEHLLKISKESK